MKKTVLATIILAAAFAVAGCGSSPAETQAPSLPDNTIPVQTEAPAAPTEEALAPIIGGQAQTGDQGGEATAFPTGIPLNQDSYSEFTEPKMYEVLEDCDTWSGNDVQTSGGQLVQGSIVTGVATDGHYLILDDQRVVELTHVQLFE